MASDIKIQCNGCVHWKNRHCENFSSKWFGMVTTASQCCGQFKPLKETVTEKQKSTSKPASKEAIS
jgi:hypothetical protein